MKTKNEMTNKTEIAKVEFTAETNRGIAEIIDQIDPHALMDDPYAGDARLAVKYIIECEENACKEEPTPWHDNPGWITITLYGDDNDEIISEAYTQHPVPLTYGLTYCEDGLPCYGDEDKNFTWTADENADGYIAADEATYRTIDKLTAEWTKEIYERNRCECDDVEMLTDYKGSPCGVEFKDRQDGEWVLIDCFVKVEWDKQYWN